MKRLLAPALCALALASCQQQTKLFTIRTLPEGATVCINGDDFEGRKTPMTVEVKQNKDLGITVVKPGYEVTTRTIETQTSTWGAILWNKNDPRAKYIEEDEVTIPMKKIPTAAEYRPAGIPGYQPPTNTSTPRSAVPALRKMPEFR